MITSMRGCVRHSDLWPLPISIRSFRHDFAIKLLRSGTSCHVCSTAYTVLDGFFPYWTQTITNMRGFVACNDLWPWPTSSRWFSYDLTIKLLKYGTSYSVCSVALKAWDEFFLYLAQMITSIRYVTCNDLDLYIQGYLAVKLSILWIIFTCGPNTTQEGTMCHVQDNRSKVKVIPVILIFAVWGTDLQFLAQSRDNKFIRIWMRITWTFSKICFMIKKVLLKWVPSIWYICVCVYSMQQYLNQV